MGKKKKKKERPKGVQLIGTKKNDN